VPLMLMERLRSTAAGLLKGGPSVINTGPRYETPGGVRLPVPLQGPKLRQGAPVEVLCSAWPPSHPRLTTHLLV
jgi:hypothetical protein